MNQCVYTAWGDLACTEVYANEVPVPAPVPTPVPYKYITSLDHYHRRRIHYYYTRLPPEQRYNPQIIQEIREKALPEANALYNENVTRYNTYLACGQAFRNLELLVQQAKAIVIKLKEDIMKVPNLPPSFRKELEKLLDQGISELMHKAVESYTWYAEEAKCLPQPPPPPDAGTT